MNDADLEALEAQYRKAVYPSHVPGANNIVFDSNLIEKGVRKLLDEVRATRLQIGDAKKLMDEFTADVRVCQAISKDCSGGDSCKCLYCRARYLIFHMDSGASEKRKAAPGHTGECEEFDDRGFCKICGLHR